MNAKESFGFCGFKLDAETGFGLEGWTIILRDLEGKEIDRTITDENGKYCFGGLRAGTYVVEEVMQDDWEAVLPADGEFEITLPAALNLIKNGDFEQGNGIGFTSQYGYVGAPGTDALWPEGLYAIGTSPKLYHSSWQDFGDHTSGSGKMMIVNGEKAISDKIVWSGSVDVLANTDYTFSFWGATSYPEAYTSLDVYINDEPVGTYDAPHFLAEWTKYETTWNSGDAVKADIKLINNILIASGNDFALEIGRAHV